MKKLIVIICALLFLFLSHNAFATDYTASSCSAADINTELAKCSDGDTIYVPEGSCTWTTTSAGSPEVSIADIEVYIIGQGDGPTITDSTGTTFLEVPFYIDNDAGTPKDSFRISNIKFTTSVVDSYGFIFWASKEVVV